MRYTKEGKYFSIFGSCQLVTLNMGMQMPTFIYLACSHQELLPKETFPLDCRISQIDKTLLSQETSLSAQQIDMIVLSCVNNVPNASSIQERYFPVTILSQLNYDQSP